MRFKGLLLFSFLLTIAIVPAFAQYQGDDDDGSSVAASCVTTLDGLDQFSFGTLTGSSAFCDFSNEAYSINVNNPPQDIQYVWSVPPDATIVAGAGTPTINVAFGNTSGVISVTVTTFCDSQTFTLIVTDGACSMYQGDIDDGFSENPSCVTTLNGDPLIVVAPNIVGSPNYCQGSQESYSIQVDNAPANVYYNWNVPTGAVVSSGQGTNIVIITFGSTDGDVSVDVITDCGVVTRTIGVTSMTCPFYSGDIDDGFSEAPSCATDLNGGPTFTITGISGSSTFCQFGTEGFAAVTINAPANTIYNWTVPSDATIITGQGTANITVQFGTTDGTVSVDIITDCATVTPTALAVAATSCSFYGGGNNDGFSDILVCATKLDGTDALIVGSIIGSTSFCEFATESYSINPQGLNPETIINWSVPAGATIVSGQGTTTILVAFSNNSGNISVDVTNLCETVSSSLPVTTTSCTFFAGGNNDGFSVVQACASTLSGGDTFIPGPVVGPTASCNFSTESYSITVAGALANAVYVWTVPSDATIISGQGTNSILVAFGIASGSVAVSVSNDCETVNASQPVTIANCIFYAGGNNDGFSVAEACASTLTGGDTFIPGPVVGSSASCNFSTESYSISVTGVLTNAVYVWTVPSDATIISGQGTSIILVAFGTTSGSISVSVSNDCETVSASLPVSVANCIFYSGGNNDGFSVTQACASTLNGGDTFIPGPIVGANASCNFSTESYSITVAGALANIVYLWTVPSGATVVSGQGTNTIIVAFGASNGNVSVAVSNECETLNASLPVTIANCIFYSGGNNDGFSTIRMCATNLNGGSQFVPGPVVGSPTFCSFSSESYSITVAGATSTTTYLWTVPAGASIVSGQGTTTILVSFGSTSGNVAVDVSNECQTINVSLPVTGSSCIFYAGGTNDGFSVTTTSNIPLPIALVSFDAEVQGGIVYLKWETSSEHDNDFFLIERSKDGRTFEPVTKVDGAGTFNGALKYQARDTNPYHGTSYYRLSQTDFDGSMAYFRVLIVKIEDFSEVTKLYPNPVNKEDLIHIDYFAEEDGQVKISIINPAGISSESNLIDAKAGVNLFEFTPHFKSAGVHIIILRSRDKAQALRLVVL